MFRIHTAFDTPAKGINHSEGDMKKTNSYLSVNEFITHHFHHFNASELKRASEAYVSHLQREGKMFLAMAGAMSTAELGLSLADMIRNDKIHAISCTGANLEEDIFNLIAQKDYVPVPNYRSLSAEDEQRLFERKLNRVTDVCIPEVAAMRRLEECVLQLWKQAEAEGKRYFPYEYMYALIRGDVLRESCQIDPRDSWLVAASEKDIPIFVAGWEDSTLGNVFAASYLQGKIRRLDIVKTGMEALLSLVAWYKERSARHEIGFFQIGGGIAGDFSICVVPLIQQDLNEDCRLWSYYCQISDSTTSYGSYSGAVPNEKITWGKLSPDTPSFIIESDATIVAPLIFAYVLGADGE